MLCFSHVAYRTIIIESNNSFQKFAFEVMYNDRKSNMIYNQCYFYQTQIKAIPPCLSHTLIKKCFRYLSRLFRRKGLNRSAELPVLTWPLSSCKLQYSCFYVKKYSYNHPLMEVYFKYRMRVQCHLIFEKRHRIVMVWGFSKFWISLFRTIS